MKIVVLLVFFYGVYSKPTKKIMFDTPEQECLPCNADFCPKIDCKFGVTKEKCGCCDTCLRDEGETCGGIGEAHGICREGLICQIRHPTSQRNLFIDPSMKIGRCEPGNIHSSMIVLSIFNTVSNFILQLYILLFFRGLQQHCLWHSSMVQES